MRYAHPSAVEQRHAFNFWPRRSSLSPLLPGACAVTMILAFLGGLVAGCLLCLVVVFGAMAKAGR